MLRSVCGLSSTARPLWSYIRGMKQGIIGMAYLSLLRLGGAIKPQVGVAMQIQKGLQHIKHLGHLSEDERLVPSCLELPQQLCQFLQTGNSSSTTMLTCVSEIVLLRDTKHALQFWRAPPVRDTRTTPQPRSPGGSFELSPTAVEHISSWPHNRCERGPTAIEIDNASLHKRAAFQEICKFFLQTSGMLECTQKHPGDRANCVGLHRTALHCTARHT